MFLLLLAQLLTAQNAERPKWLIADSLLCSGNAEDTLHRIWLMQRLPAGKVIKYPINKSYAIKCSYDDFISVCRSKNSADDMRDYEQQVKELEEAAKLTDTLLLEDNDANNYILYHLLLSGRVVIYEPISHTNALLMFHRLEKDEEALAIDAFYLVGNRRFFSFVCRFGGLMSPR